MKKYLQGPFYEGLDMGLIEEGYRFLHLALAADPEAKVFSVSLPAALAFKQSSETLARP
jgi:hypothetical protein